MAEARAVHPGSASPAAGALDNASLRRGDPRFLLPVSVRDVVAMAGAEDWAAALRPSDDPAEPSRAEGPDVVVAPAGAAAAAARLDAPIVLLEGGGGWRDLEARGYRAQRWMALPSLDAPRALIPVGNPTVAGYALSSWAAPDRRWKRARNQAVSALVGHGFEGGARRALTIGLRSPAPPFLVAAARSLGVPSDAGLSLHLGGADVLSRAAFQIFPKGSRSPRWVLKFSRVRGYERPFVDDERGLRLIAGVGGPPASHAPRLLGRLHADGYQASVETAAVGQPLNQFLASSVSRAVKLAAVAKVAGWALEVAERTAARGETLRAERRRLAKQVLPCWGASTDLVEALPDGPAIVQHNDLGCWNVMVGGGDFCVVDWESAVGAGLPLWDLFYFLTDALALVDGAGETGWDTYVGRLYRGELPSSAILFDWTRRFVGALGIPPGAVGPMAALCWMHHGISHLSRQATGARFGTDISSLPRAERVAPVWLSDPALGTSWDRWRA